MKCCPLQKAVNVSALVQLVIQPSLYKWDHSGLLIRFSTEVGVRLGRWLSRLRHLISNLDLSSISRTHMMERGSLILTICPLISTHVLIVHVHPCIYKYAHLYTCGIAHEHAYIYIYISYIHTHVYNTCAIIRVHSYICMYVCIYTSTDPQKYMWENP